MKSQKKYKYKLNMLEPGGVMIKLIAILSLAAFIFYLVKIYQLCLLFIGIGGLVFLILIILLTIEQHQDRVLYEDAKEHDKDIK